MLQIFYMDEIEKNRDFLDKNILALIKTSNLGAFEELKNVDLFSFSFYNFQNPCFGTNQIMIYLDGRNLIFFCDGKNAYEKVLELIPEETRKEIKGSRGKTEKKNEQVLWLFFQNLLKKDMNHLEDMECEIAEAEMAAMVRFRDEDIRKVIMYRKELLRLKRYYEQLDTIMDGLAINENHLLSQEGAGHFATLGKQTTRYLNNVLNLRDYVTQMRETYQAQLDIEQNNLMRIFTVITSVFLPLTLMVGWYGMNFQYMPEIRWKYGYLLFAASSAAVSISMLFYFRKKKYI